MTTSLMPSISSPLRDSHDDVEHAKMKWDELGFGFVPTDFMYVMKCSKEGNFMDGSLVPFGNIELSPCAGVLNYGQGLFEGLKAYRKNDGSVQLFRPEQNALRMMNGANRLCMPSPSVDQFIDAVKKTVIANISWVPPSGKGTLYLRPLLMGSGALLGLAPAPEYTFLIYACPVGNYHKGLTPLNLYVEDKLRRASCGGTGDVKAISNYAPVFLAQTRAKENGFSDVIFLDAVAGKYIEEASSSNIFILKGNVLSTPALKGTILPGITRKSILEIATTFGYQVEERLIPVEDLLQAEEAFCTGTAVIINAIAAITYRDRRMEYKTGTEALYNKIYEILSGIQTGIIEDKMGWTVQVN